LPADRQPRSHGRGRRLRRRARDQRGRRRAARTPYHRLGRPVIDWLRRGNAEPSVTVAGRDLPLAIRRHARATRLTMRLAPDGSEVRITLPQWGRTADAVSFASKKVEWLEEQLARIPRAEPPRPDGALAYRGRQLTIEWNSALPRKPAVHDDRLRLGGPHETVA